MAQLVKWNTQFLVFLLFIYSFKFMILCFLIKSLPLFILFILQRLVFVDWVLDLGILC